MVGTYYNVEKESLPNLEIFAVFLQLCYIFRMDFLVNISFVHSEITENSELQFTLCVRANALLYPYDMVQIIAFYYELPLLYLSYNFCPWSSVTCSLGFSNVYLMSHTVIA